MGLLHEVVQLGLIAVHPRSRDHFVEKTPAETNRSVEAAVLVEGKERFGVRLQAPAEPGGVAVPQVRAEHRLVTQGPADAAGAVDEQAGRDLERTAAPVELL